MNRLFEYRVYPKTEEPIPFCWKVLFVLFMLGTLLAMAAVCSSCQPEEEGMEAVDMEERFARYHSCGSAGGRTGGLRYPDSQ